MIKTTILTQSLQAKPMAAVWEGIETTDLTDFVLAGKSAETFFFGIGKDEQLEYESLAKNEQVPFYRSMSNSGNPPVFFDTGTWWIVGKYNIRMSLPALERFTLYFSRAVELVLKKYSNDVIREGTRVFESSGKEFFSLMAEHIGSQILFQAFLYLSKPKNTPTYLRESYIQGCRKAPAGIDNLSNERDIVEDILYRLPRPNTSQIEMTKEEINSLLQLFETLGGKYINESMVYGPK